MTIYKRFRRNNHREQNKVRLWKNKLQGQPCFVLGNSPCLDDVAIYKLENFFTIGINRSFKRLDSTILMWQDIELYLDCRKKILNLKSILYARENSDPSHRAFSFKLLHGDYALTNNPTVLAGRGSTVPLAFQLAVLLGCEPIVFLGYDCCYRDGKTDFYGVNLDHKPHTLDACMAGQIWIEDTAKKINKEIIDCSNSKIFNNKKDFNSVVEDLSQYKKSREEYLKMLI